MSRSAPQAVADHFYGPLQSAFPDLERRCDFFFGGNWVNPPAGQVGHAPGDIAGEGWWVTTAGHYIGTFKQAWLGIPATGEPGTLRFGEFYRWQVQPDGSGKITEARVLLDIVELARQAGRRTLPPSSGLEILVPGPAQHDGLLRGETDSAAGVESMRLTLAMFTGLGAYDGKHLDSMDMPRFWHPNMMWYGPCGIGTSRGVKGFQRHHQAPFFARLPRPEQPQAGATWAPCAGRRGALRGLHRLAQRARHLHKQLPQRSRHRPAGRHARDVLVATRRQFADRELGAIDLPHLMLQMGVDLMGRLESP